MPNPKNICYIVGVAGGSAAGKSTFVNELMSVLEDKYSSLRVSLLRSDGYFRNQKSSSSTYFSPTFNMELPDYNHPDALDTPHLLADLKEMTKPVEQIDVLIVEGHFVLCIPEIRDQLDLRIFIELDADTRALRRMVRNLVHQGDPLPDHSAESIANYYLESAKEGHRKYIQPSQKYADFILRGDGDFRRSSSQTAAVILSEYGNNR